MTRPAQQIRDAVASVLPTVRADLERLVRIPSVSADASARPRLQASAEEVARQLREAGLTNVTIANADGGLPAVIGFRPGAPGAPTVLLYAHHDVQPVGDLGAWDSEPFEPVERDGRLYGRGAADDKAGIAVHCAAVRALGEHAGVSIAVLVDGEEEIGSPTLPSLLDNCARVPGTAVFLVSHAGFVPTALLRNLEHNHVCHEQILIMNFEIVRSPRQDRVSRAWVEELMPNVHAVHARFGFMETPDVTEAIRGARQRGLRINDADCTYFVGWHLVRAKPRSGLSGLKAEIFAYLQRRSTQAAEFFRMPTRRVVVLATEIEI